MSKVSLSSYTESLKKLEQYPIEFVKHNLLLKLHETESDITIGFANNLKESLKTSLWNLHNNKNLFFVEIKKSELTSYLSKKFTYLDPTHSENYNENDLTQIANNAPVINLVNSIIIDGINLGASDIHIEAYKNDIKLRYRVDGVLEDREPINKSIFSAVSSRIKIMSNLNIMESRLPQNGRVTVNIESKKIDLRVSIVPISDGESIVLRLFIIKDNLTTLTDLGFKNSNLTKITKALKNPNGLIIISGPTGSGKTTTLNSMIKILSSRDKKVITIEDPVEYKIEGVNQIEVNTDIGLTFSNILKQVLRQDPDIIMVGEIRDKETANLVISAALTGHLVLSTLHTNDSVSVIHRLKELGIQDYLISSVLKGSFAQRLVRVTCKKCLGVGCKECNSSGYKNRLAICEGFLTSETLEELIVNKSSKLEIKTYLKNNGFIDLSESATQLINDKTTTKEEVKRVLNVD